MKKNYTIPMIAICSVILSGCQPITKVVLRNDSSQLISVIQLYEKEKTIDLGDTKKRTYIQSYEKEKTIGLGDTKKLIYLTGNPHKCVRIKVNDTLYKQQISKPMPAKYYHVGNFSTSIYTRFTEDYKLRIYDKDNPSDFMELNKGCEMQGIN